MCARCRRALRCRLGVVRTTFYDSSKIWVWTIIFLVYLSHPIPRNAARVFYTWDAYLLPAVLYFRVYPFCCALTSPVWMSCVGMRV